MERNSGYERNSEYLHLFLPFLLLPSFFHSSFPFFDCSGKKFRELLFRKRLVLNNKIIFLSLTDNLTNDTEDIK